MNDYTIKNCATDNLDTFRANVRKCINELNKHRDEEHAQIVLQTKETNEGTYWNMFIYPSDNGTFTISWQECKDGEYIDYDFYRQSFNGVINEAIEDDTTWRNINLMEVTW